MKFEIVDLHGARVSAKTAAYAVQLAMENGFNLKAATMKVYSLEPPDLEAALAAAKGTGINIVKTREPAK